MASNRGRLVQINQVVLDQADLFQPDGFTRIAGLTPNNLTSSLFYNNVAQPWALVDGSAILDTQVKSGNIYWHEVSGNPGIYSLRFRPNAVGYWRMIITYPAGTQILGQDFDVVAQVPIVESGLKASFIKPG